MPPVTCPKSGLTDRSPVPTPLSGLILEAQARLKSHIDLKYLPGLERANQPSQARLVDGLNLLALFYAIP